MPTPTHILTTAMILFGSITSGCSSGKVATDPDLNDSEFCDRARSDNRLDCQITLDEALHAQNLADFSILLEDEFTTQKNLNVIWATLAGEYQFTYLQATGPDCKTPTTGFVPMSGLTATEQIAEFTADGDYFICLFADSPKFATIAAKNNGYKITLDTVAPEAPLVTGIAATTNPNPEWSWTAKDTSGNGRYRASINSEEFSDNAAQFSSTNYQPEEPYEDGTYRLYIQTRDEAGNWSKSGSFETLVDTTPPTVELTQVFDDVSPNFLHIQIDFSESVTGFEIKDLILKNAVVVDMTGQGQHYNLVLNSTAVNPTVEIPEAVCEDIVGLPNPASQALTLSFDIPPQ